ncbi:two-component response regulator-like PRR73-like protein [Corchorus olitorius]|uniref:Two-component response regulator-like PRR73-like protein n=1 Tax=Corchorus olitorius TaxID=93759 RepID=A0A1R3IL38_9ROSI|nr:two-component response regulator-like PRR73-like protein [Corchorus olitorius]
MEAQVTQASMESEKRKKRDHGKRLFLQEGPRPREKLRVSPGEMVKREGEKDLTSVTCVRLLFRRDCAWLFMEREVER